MKYDIGKVKEITDNNWTRKIILALDREFRPVWVDYNFDKQIF